MLHCLLVPFSEKKDLLSHSFGSFTVDKRWTRCNDSIYSPLNPCPVSVVPSLMRFLIHRRSRDGSRLPANCQTPAPAPHASGRIVTSIGNQMTGRQLFHDQDLGIHSVIHQTPHDTGWLFHWPGFVSVCETSRQPVHPDQRQRIPCTPRWCNRSQNYRSSAVQQETLVPVGRMLSGTMVSDFRVVLMIRPSKGLTIVTRQPLVWVGLFQKNSPAGSAASRSSGSPGWTETNYHRDQWKIAPAGGCFIIFHQQKGNVWFKPAAIGAEIICTDREGNLRESESEKNFENFVSAGADGVVVFSMLKCSKGLDPGREWRLGAEQVVRVIHRPGSRINFWKCREDFEYQRQTMYQDLCVCVCSWEADGEWKVIGREKRVWEGRGFDGKIRAGRERK